jgi:adenylate cyclase
MIMSTLSSKALTSTDASFASTGRKKSSLRSKVDELTGKLEHAELLLDISKQMAACTTSDESLETFLGIMVEQTQAERGTLFLNDPQTGELYSRVSLGNFRREIRIINTSGIAGYVFGTGECVNVPNAYADERFDPSIDEKTGFTTKGIICVPIQTIKNEIIGVAQVINKFDGDFSEDDLNLLSVMTHQAALALKSMQRVEYMQKKREQEVLFLDIVSDITSEIKLTNLLQKVMKQATRMLNADRGTLFLNDGKTNELYTEVGHGIDVKQIRFPNSVGIAGTVFSDRESVNIAHAYADLRFNPTFDKQTGYFTRSILCVPVINKQGKTIGATQMLNKHGGAFTQEDERRLKAFTAQISIALENAKLFDDLQNMKSYTDSMLESMSSGVFTVDPDGVIVTCNQAASRILKMRRMDDILQQKVGDFFLGENAWLVEAIEAVAQNKKPKVFMDKIFVRHQQTISINITISPLLNVESESLGRIVMMEDISNEKRLKSTLARGMGAEIADQVLGEGKDSLGGQSIRATVLFSDVRSFTTIAEELGPKGTVKLLNEYFTIMNECIHNQGGIVDKFIGDAIMARFGPPKPHDDDEDRALRASIAMLSKLRIWNEQRIARGERPIDMGIGLNTDNVVSGYIGSPNRSDFTMIGDGVNLAARLESACKQYFARVLISANTRQALRGTYRIREIDKVVVKGKTEPVAIYEVLDYHDDMSFPNLMEVVSQFSNGLKHYRSQNWSRAMAAFGEALALNPRDRLCDLYIERCQYWQKNHPPGDWNGVWIMTSK